MQEVGQHFALVLQNMLNCLGSGPLWLPAAIYLSLLELHTHTHGPWLCTASPVTVLLKTGWLQQWSSTLVLSGWYVLDVSLPSVTLL